MQCNRALSLSLIPVRLWGFIDRILLVSCVLSGTLLAYIFWVLVTSGPPHGDYASAFRLILVLGAICLGSIAISRKARRFVKGEEFDKKCFSVEGKILSAVVNTELEQSVLLSVLKMERDSSILIFENVVIPDHLIQNVQAGAEGKLCFLRPSPSLFSSKQYLGLFGVVMNNRSENHSEACRQGLKTVLNRKSDRFEDFKRTSSGGILYASQDENQQIKSYSGEAYIKIAVRRVCSA